MKAIVSYLSAIACLLPLVAVAEAGMDQDGVPKIDLHGRTVVLKVPALTPIGQPAEFENVEKRVVTVSGKDMSLREFFNTYCHGKAMTNSTCSRAAKISDLDGLKRRDGKLPPLPAGL